VKEPKMVRIQGSEQLCSCTTTAPGLSFKEAVQPLAGGSALCLGDWQS